MLFCCLTASSVDAQNEIRKDTFNFAQQLGYLYSHQDDAYTHPRGWWSLRTGALVYYTRKMARVENPDWQRRTFVQLPGQLRVAPGDRIVLQVDSDLVAEWPRQDKHSWGGNSPRFRTKIGLLQEHDARPALAMTVGVKFSSAKPTNIFEDRHNYRDSNGLAGLGTGVADYFIVFHVGKRPASDVTLNAHVGLAPLGDPTAYDRGSSQADEILWGGTVDWTPGAWRVQVGAAGMSGVLTTTHLHHYAVARLQLGRRWQRRGRIELAINAERGLTWTSDDWVGGLLVTTEFRRERKFWRDETD
ncbi:MAG: hypothetical protein D6761_07785 [Candidatus Dadabacteria bacterium]|nr:MAG: hypothetical protein D6761_07785 [Candidatus Dadabacteria bacterium]